MWMAGRAIDRRMFVKRIATGTVLVLTPELLAGCGGSTDAGAPPAGIAVAPAVAPTSTPAPAPSPTPSATPTPTPTPTAYYQTTDVAALRASYAGVAPFLDQVPVFVSEYEKSPRSGTATYYRIPAITHGKTLVHAFAEARFVSQTDGGEVSVAWRTLSGAGDQVSAEVILVQDKSSWPDGVLRRNNNGQPCAVYDTVNGHLHLLFHQARGDLNENTQTLPSVNPQTTGRMRAIVSVDGDGARWQASIGGAVLDLPVDYTRAAATAGRRDDWRLFMPGPGHGICTPDGVLLAPGWIQLTDGGYRTIILRYDRPSATWTVSGVMPGNSSEGEITWTKAGKLVVNARQASGGGRAVGISSDLGATWDSVTTDTALPDPGCFGSVLRAGKLGGPSEILFANPANNADRIDLEIRLSLDEHRTFPVKRRLYPTLVETSTTSWEGKTVPPVSVKHYTAYSDLVALDNDTYGLLLEQTAVTNRGGANSNWVISLVRFNLPWLLQGS